MCFRFIFYCQTILKNITDLIMWICIFQGSGTSEESTGTSVSNKRYRTSGKQFSLLLLFCLLALFFNLILQIVTNIFVNDMHYDIFKHKTMT